MSTVEETAALSTELRGPGRQSSAAATQGMKVRGGERAAIPFGGLKPRTAAEWPASIKGKHDRQTDPPRQGIPLTDRYPDSSNATCQTTNHGEGRR
jgi:hypothetical protein